MKNDSLPEGLLSAMEMMADAAPSYQAASDFLMRNSELLSMSLSPVINELGINDDVLANGVLNDSLTETVSGMLEAYYEFSGVKAAIEALGSSCEKLIKPDVYVSTHVIGASITDLVQSAGGIQTIQSALDPLIKAADAMDTSWLNKSSAWSVEKSVLKGLDVDSLSGLSTPFSRLCALEHETSLLSCIPETLTSAVSQIASITEVLNRSLPTGWKCNCLVSTSRLINEYCELATSQHEQLKRAGDSAEVSWRLGILDAASNIVDRQVSWHLDLAGAMAAEGIACPYEDVFDAGSSVLPLIPTHIGYTRRDNITPAEGLEKAQIISINEKGKQIADKVITINKLRLDSGEDRIFNLTETVFSGLFRLGDTVCSKEGELGIIIDALYFTFYENLKHIKLFLGDGDESKGDKLVRNDSVFGCIFDVKTIRSDLRHDLDHGKPNDVKKKLMNVGSCYQEYCGNRPLKPKDFKRLQERLYDKVISLEDSLIQMMAPSSFADCAG